MAAAQPSPAQGRRGRGDRAKGALISSGVGWSGRDPPCRELAAEAHRQLGQGDGQATAASGLPRPDPSVLALAAATAVGASGADNRAWADAAGTRFSSGHDDH